MRNAMQSQAIERIICNIENSEEKEEGTISMRMDNICMVRRRRRGGGNRRREKSCYNSGPGDRKLTLDLLELVSLKYPGACSLPAPPAPPAPG